MRGTSCAETFDSIEALPADALTLLDEAPGLFAGRLWWDVVLAHAIPTGSVTSIVVIRTAGQVTALVPMLRSGGRLCSLTTPYTCDYTPLFAAGLDEAMRLAAIAAFGRHCRASGVVRLDALPAEWPGLAELEAGMRRAGLRALRFEHFGNWYEDVGGLGWSDYLLARPGALRETVRRRLRRAERLAEASFDLITRPAQMDRGAAAFESVYGRSWKEAEPFPTFNVALMRAMAASGALRLGVWSLAGVPVAVQFWAIKDSTAVVLKLAHDEAFKTHSPGTVLTALMLRHLLDRERVVRIDFGRGDDAYKHGWAKLRRPRVGILLANPWHPAGAAALARHAAGRVRAALRRGKSPP